MRGRTTEIAVRPPRASRTSSDAERALIDVGRWLRAGGYRFTTVTPETHLRVLARRGDTCAASLRDVFGWSMPFRPGVIPDAIVDALRAAYALDERGDELATRVRFSTLGAQLFVHSAFPTDATDAVFFGPDTYRYCAALAHEIRGADRVVDIGAGSGAGGLSLADRCRRITLTDCNPLAVTYARVNAVLAGCTERVELALGDLFEPVRGAVDLVIANPPYIADSSARVYRDGGGELGTALALRIIDGAMSRLAPGGKLVLYTGAPIRDGVDLVHTAATRLLGSRAWTYTELDPDVFGEELSRPTYAGVERIAAVLLVAFA